MVTALHVIPKPKLHYLVIGQLPTNRSRIHDVFSSIFLIICRCTFLSLRIVFTAKIVSWKKTNIVKKDKTQKMANISRRYLWCPREIPYWRRVITQIWVALLIGRAAREICFNQSESLPRSGWWRVISIEFLRSFLRRHFVEKSGGVAKCLLFPHLIPKTEFHAQSFVYKSRKCLACFKRRGNYLATYQFLIAMQFHFFKLQVNDGKRENIVSRF